MNVTIIKARIDEIKAVLPDYEAAHSLEDTLHQDVLRAIGDGTARNTRACANAALATLNVEFARYCA